MVRIVQVIAFATLVSRLTGGNNAVSAFEYISAMVHIAVLSMREDEICKPQCCRSFVGIHLEALGIWRSLFSLYVQFNPCLHAIYSSFSYRQMIACD